MTSGESGERWIEVAAAVIERPDGSFLLAQRPAGKVYEGWWEFPGGKVESGEAVAHALGRELVEELGVEVVSAYPWICRTFRYPHGNVRLHFFRVTQWRGEPKSREGQAFAWQTLPDLSVTPILPVGCPQWRHEGEIPMTSLHRFPSGKVEVKMKVVGFDAADGFSRSAAEIFARRQMHGLIHYLQTIGYRGRKLDTHVLASVSRGIGVREERRIIGEHVLTEAEARRAVIFPDAVAVNTYHIDFHWPDRMERAGTGVTDMLDPHHLPLRMMIPRGARNLLVPGRGASGDQKAMSAFRVMAVVAQMGCAAGHAARQCLERGTDLAGIDVARLQAAIEADGQSLNLSDYGDYLRQDHFTHEVAAPAAAAAAVRLTAGRDACFQLDWRDSAGHGQTAVRRELAWSRSQRADVPFHIPTAVEPEARVALDDGSLARVWCDAATGAVVAALSSDAGITWPHRRELASGVDVAVAPAAVATRTGLAVAYADAAGALWFWHGSVERIISGPPVPSAVRLDAPPDHVAAS